MKLHEQAKSLVKINQKDRALLVLKLKKHKEKTVDSIENQLLQVFELIDTIEWESTNIQVSNNNNKTDNLSTHSIILDIHIITNNGHSLLYIIIIIYVTGS